VMTSAGQLSELLALIYDAGLTDMGQPATEPASADTCWQLALDWLAKCVGAGASAILVSCGRHRHLPVITANSDPAAIASYFGHYRLLDPMSGPMTAGGLGELVVGSDHHERTKFQRSQFFNDFCRPFVMEDCASITLLRESHNSVQLLVPFALETEAFRREQRQILSLIAPHLHRASQAARQLGALRNYQDSLLATLGRLTVGLLLADAEGRVCFANETADALLACGDGIGLERGGDRGTPSRLRAATPPATIELRALISRVAGLASAADAGQATPEDCPEYASMALRRPPGKRPLSVLAVPLMQRSAAATLWNAMDRRAAVALFVTDPNHTTPSAGIAANTLRVIYGLTGSEAEVAVAVAKGEGLEAVARQRGVALATIRTQVQRAFDKTGARGQVELVRLVERTTFAR
jgi:DNA-binding CsgD family transcriptional regulator